MPSHAKKKKKKKSVRGSSRRSPDEKQETGGVRLLSRIASSSILFLSVSLSLVSAM